MSARAMSTLWLFRLSIIWGGNGIPQSRPELSTFQRADMVARPWGPDTAAAHGVQTDDDAKFRNYAPDQPDPQACDHRHGRARAAGIPATRLGASGRDRRHRGRQARGQGHALYIGADRGGS